MPTLNFIKNSRIARWSLSLVAIAALLATSSCVETPPGEPVFWTPVTNIYAAKPGDFSAHLSFTAKNVSKHPVVIDGVKTSCGCTSAKMPREPWILAPGEKGKMEVTVDLRGKAGSTLIKGITVQSTNAPKELIIQVSIPRGGTNSMSTQMADRLWNQEMSKADRQAVFKADCVKCHLEPAFGKSGAALYQAACAVCHDTPHRASFVPDLNTLKVANSSANYWRNWVAHGKENTLMPAFAATEGGPLDDAQIDSLVAYFLTKYPPKKD